ncbi:MAG: family transporter protein [Geminicoccaceae bacterium]|nr:family transporter protein [Geminicoccaceae bacterium]
MSIRRLWLVTRHELAFNVRRPLFYICLAVLAFIVWGLSTGNVQIIIASGDASVGGKKAWLTSEFAAAQILTVSISTFMSFFVAAAAGMTVIRDDELRVRELLHSTPLTAGEYISGKYFATVVSALGMLAGLILLMLLLFHGVPNAQMAESRGPLSLVNYLRPALILAVPALVIITGVVFGVGTWTRKPILVFVLPIVLVLAGFFFLWTWSPSWLDPRVNRLLMLIDPSGVRWLNETYLEVDRGADYYNTQRIGFDAGFLASRLALGLAGIAAVVASGVHFARTLRQSGRVKTKKLAAEPPATVGAASVASVSAPLASLAMRSGAPGLWQSVWHVARSELRELRSEPGLYVFVPLILFQTIANSLITLGAFDTPLLLTPGTIAVTQMQFLITLLSLLLIFYAVESMERERATGFSAVANALPIRTAAIVFGKVIALCAIGVIIGVVCLVAAWIALLVQGRVGFDIVPFLIIWGGLVAPTFVAWAAFVIAAYCVTRNRYSAYGVALGAFVYTAYRAITGDINWIGNWPMWGAVRWSDMSTLEIDRSAVLLSRLMVGGLAALFLYIAIKQYPRRDRDAIRMIHRARPAALRASFLRAVPALVIPVLAGGMLWRQVDRGPDGGRFEKQAKDYWKKNLATWREASLPALADVDLDLTIEPAERSWSVKGTYVLVNKRDTRLVRVPLTTSPAWRDLKWTMNGTPYTPDTSSLLYVFTPPAPLMPGDTLRLGFSFSGRETGATENGGGASEFILPSGVVMTSFTPRWFPVLGYLEQIGVEDDENDYEPRQYPDDFYEGVTDPAFGSELPMTTRIAITTPADFIANSVGEMISDSTAAGRRTVVWESDHPVMAFNVVAARWQVKRGNGTVLYYHPEHTYNIAEMSEALDAARKYYGEWFGVFPWKELKLSEFPDLATYAQGFPTNITFSEGIGFLTKSDPKTNLAFLVTAHEAAHQWWGNMLQPGRGPGGNILSEGMSHFSTALLIEQVKGERDAMEFRKRIESRYGDTRQSDAERKLLRIDGSKAGDGTVTYDKGGWVFWMLLQRMGREPALSGMKDFIAAYRGNPDHPVLHDFVTHMRGYAPDPAAYDDFARQWFDSVVVPEYRVHNAKTVAAPDGSWITTAEVENVGSGRMPIEVAAVAGERFPDTTAAKKPAAYRTELVAITLGGKERRAISIRTSFKPERVVVDPNVRVLQLRRESAEARL